MEKGMIDAISLLKSSEYRLKIIQAIGNDTPTPSEIADRTKIRLNHVSMFLKELKENDMVKCLNEGTRKGRLYELTELGKNAIKRLKQNKI
ncbi:MAG: winged helix-turn-helix domain-containing protein [Nanoarchaeota archaeon]|nr:winged helix-turn-helix domain-containing protein [Nanoarchaeota archaeon]